MNLWQFFSAAASEVDVLRNDAVISVVYTIDEIVTFFRPSRMVHTRLAEKVV